MEHPDRKQNGTYAVGSKATSGTSLEALELAASEPMAVRTILVCVWIGGASWKGLGPISGTNGVDMIIQYFGIQQCSGESGQSSFERLFLHNKPPHALGLKLAQHYRKCL